MDILLLLFVIFAAILGVAIGLRSVSLKRGILMLFAIPGAVTAVLFFKPVYNGQLTADILAGFFGKAIPVMVVVAAVFAVIGAMVNWIAKP
ncbi:MAG: hypothetical protein MUF47_14075 [Porphyrobacter sp.]|nr:hypothetical protein [Porphyrobacter sp.]